MIRSPEDFDALFRLLFKMVDHDRVLIEDKTVKPFIEYEEAKRFLNQPRFRKYMAELFLR